MAYGTVLDRTTISLNALEYKLARREVLEKVGRARSWRVERVHQATKIEPRPDVRQGDVPDEYVITWDNFNRGIAGDHENIPGTVHYATDAITYHRGSIKALPPFEQFLNSTDETDDPATIVEFVDVTTGIHLLIAGRYAYSISNGGVYNTDKDFGAGYVATDAIFFNNEIIVGFGGSSNKIWTRDSAGTWTQAADAVYADYFALVEDRLWRATATNEVSNIASTDNPRTLANWSSGIAIGDDDVSITGLVDSGQRLVVAKENGFHVGDAAAIFPRVYSVPSNVANRQNGVNTSKWGAAVVYPYDGGCALYEDGRVREIGLEQSFTQANQADQIPGVRISAIAEQGHYLWCATRPSLLPRAEPTGFQKTLNSGVAYTDYTTQVTDNDLSTVAILDALDTVANGDWVVIGYSATFYGIVLDLYQLNNGVATATLEYWSGAAWSAFAANNPAVDRTANVGPRTLGRSSEGIMWRTPPADWASSTINGINAFWVRYSVSAALGADVRVSEARILTSQQNSYVFRGRLTRENDNLPTVMVWEPVFAVQSGQPVTALYISDKQSRYGHTGPYVLASARQMTHTQGISASGTVPALLGTTRTGSVYLPKHDGGFPYITKQFLALVLKGRTIDSDRDVGLYYRLDENTSWVTVASSIITSPSSNTLTGVSGRSIQPRIDMNAHTTDYPTEVNELECIFRIRPTYKNIYTCVFELADYQSSSQGGLSDAAIQLDNLEDLQGAAPFVMIDAVGRRVGGTSGLVMLSSLSELEYVQEGLDYPVLAVEVILAEV